ncbi:MAG TPA: tryptophan--tRNA ligase [Planctomycetota bacterium]|nr:tryptophan--tRNA ligase [Planctomycetota bacterium]
MERVFSGIQPSGALHIGNWLGALRNWVALAERHECFYSIVDLHALTASPPPRPEELRQRVREVAVSLLACGLDPRRSTLFVQSEVPEHAELAWILGCHAAMGDLGRMTQFKEKSEGQREIVGLGLFAYPVLQTADILLYKATRVPVGEDQVQHLELAREIARRFNRTYGPTFPEPEAILSPTPRVLGLDGQRKMSKSLGNEIGLLEPAASVKEKLAGAMTDPARKRRSDPGDPAKCNVFTWHTFFTPEEDRERCAVGCRTAAIGCLDCKEVLRTHLEGVLAPMRERAGRYLSDPGSVDEVLRDGARRAGAIARKTMEEVRHRVGLR